MKLSAAAAHYDGLMIDACNIDRGTCASNGKGLWHALPNKQTVAG